MPIILGLLAAVGFAIFWMTRARQAADITSELADAAAGVLNAARRFGFRRQANVHPVESIEQVNLAIGGLAVAFGQLTAIPTAEQQSALLRALQSNLKIGLTEAEETVVLGNWFVTQCNGAEPAVSRLARKLNKLGGQKALNEALSVINAATVGDLSVKQREALAEIARVFQL